jgi:predicted dehydrogenase
MVAQVLRFWPEYAYVREAARDGRFGRLLYVRSGRRQAMPAWTVGNWMADPKLSHGGVVDFQIHDLDFVTSLFGMPESLMSVGTVGPYGGWEQITTVMRHGGAVSCAEACNMMPEGYPFTAAFVAVFEKASVDFNCNAAPTLTVRGANGEAFNPDLAGTDGYQNEIDYFVRCVRDGTEITEATGENGAAALKLALLSKTSLESGREVIV